MTCLGIKPDKCLIPSGVIHDKLRVFNNKLCTLFEIFHFFKYLSPEEVEFILLGCLNILSDICPVKDFENGIPYVKAELPVFGEVGSKKVGGPVLPCGF